MSALRFHHVFFLLMLLALICAFSLRPERSAKITPQIQTLFAPVATPLRSVGRALDERIHRPAVVDPRSAKVIAQENEELRVANASLTAQLDQLKVLNRDRDVLGDVRKAAKTYAVTGNDSGPRETLMIGGSTLEGLQIGQPAVFVGGIAGRVVQAGIAGAKVQLITDVGAPGMTGHFGRHQKNADGSVEFVSLPLPGVASVFVSGAGRNTLVINTLTMAQVEAVQPNDWIVLADGTWPANLQGYKIGQVISKEPRPDSPLFALITVQPSKVLKNLTDVSVVLK